MKLSGGKRIISSIVRLVINNINSIALEIAIDEFVGLLNYIYLNSLSLHSFYYNAVLPYFIVMPALFRQGLKNLCELTAQICS